MLRMRAGVSQDEAALAPSRRALTRAPQGEGGTETSSCTAGGSSEYAAPWAFASRTADGWWREPRVAVAATAEPLVDGQDSVPHADGPATYIPLAKALQNERNLYDDPSAHSLSHPQG